MYIISFNFSLKLTYFFFVINRFKCRSYPGFGGKGFFQGIGTDITIPCIKLPVENICGFSWETVIEVTTKIESQEQRRDQNNVIGFPEHPHAAVTDDLETFYGITHRDLGNVFTLKQFKEYWPKSVQ